MRRGIRIFASKEESGRRSSHAPRRSPPPSGEAVPFAVVSAGSLDEANGFLVLLEAFARLPGDGYRLRIAGRGPLESQVRAAAAKDPRIEYLGFLSFEEVQSLYRSADVLVNMRLTQAIDTRYFFPSKLMEYLASAVPVISTCTGAVEKEFGSFVYLLREETPQGLANAICTVAALAPSARADTGHRVAAIPVGPQNVGRPGRQDCSVPSSNRTRPVVLAGRRGGVSRRVIDQAAEAPFSQIFLP